MNLPLKIQANNDSDQVYIMPNNLNIRFSLDEIEPTATVTSIATPTNTPEPTVTATATATSTPAMGTTNIRCQGKSKIDFGKLDINEDGSVTARQDCEMVVESEYVPMAMLVNIESNDEEILPYLSLQAGNISGKSVQVPSETSSVSVLLNMPAEVVQELKGGTHKFEAKLVFVSEDTALVGDFKRGETNLPIEFQVVKPKSKLPYFIAGGLVALIVLIALIKGLAKKSAPPIVNLIMEKRDGNGFESVSFMNTKASRIEGNKFKVSVGSSLSNDMPVNGLPEEAFDIIAIKGKESMDYFIQPKTEIYVEGLLKENQFRLVEEDTLSIGASTIKFIIGK